MILAVLSENLQKYGPSPFSDELVEIACEYICEATALAINSRLTKEDLFKAIMSGKENPKAVLEYRYYLKSQFDAMKTILDISTVAYMLFSNRLVSDRLLQLSDYVWGVSYFFAPWEHIKPIVRTLLAMSSDFNDDYYLKRVKEIHAIIASTEIRDLSNEHQFSIIGYETLRNAVRIDLETRFQDNSKNLGHTLYTSNYRQLPIVFDYISYKVAQSAVEIGIFSDEMIILPEKEPHLCSYNYDCSSCPHYAEETGDNSYAEGIAGYD